MKKYVAEAIGTFVLTFLGCGAAVSLGCAEDNTAAVVGTAIAFGLAVVAMAYTIGGVSGCHINPAITLACFIDKRISAKDCCGYICGQLVGGIVAGACLAAIYCCTSGLGANGIGAGCHGSVTTALVVEAILTALFVLVVLGSTDSKVGAGNFAGLAIGLSLILIHLVGIHFTGTSVNPARSIGPALFAGGEALANVWVFIVGPFIGSVIAVILWKLAGPCCCSKCEKE
ncbi:MAG: aquaporin [Prevotella sp.]|jgi:aquaporin Z|nr:aquaporin [Prevotella sp.]MBR4378674.1 aquaporin [Prevotella sp.]